MEMAQSGVKTRARAALTMGPATAGSAAPTPKRRKVSTKRTRRNSSSSAVVKPEPEKEEGYQSHISDELPASCCSSNGSVRLDKEKMKLLDLEVESAQVETSTCNGGEEIQRKEMSRAIELQGDSQEMNSMEANSRRRVLSTGQIMPSKLELEEFFTTAEKDLQKRFQDKYNFDVVKDVPLEGRYEWVALKP